ncbi:MAG: Crp/Fnr family transcriptional regulator [Acidobacteria bacterium]|nr:MAG: Crp/Fnr family transcriptional regulator [Acidobacteriota bacterium]
MSNALRQPTENHILATLSPEDYERIAPHLEPVNLPQGQTLYQAGEPIKHVYFPTNSMVSLVSQMSDGANVEVGIIGFEGMVGLSCLLGVDESPYEAIVQIQDGALRMSAQTIKREFKRGGALHDLLLRYTQSLLLMTSQVAACNRVHGIGERLARWLLMSYDRCVYADLPLTHEFIATMLGVRRAGVTEAASILQTEGLITYHRGHITIKDKQGLEEFACECYQIIKTEFDHLLH